MTEERTVLDAAAETIAKELNGEVLRARIEDDQIVVLLVDGRKVRRPLLETTADAPSAPPKKEKKK